MAADIAPDVEADVLAGNPPVRVGRRFLPVAAATLPPLPDDAGPVDLPLAPGTPVHAVQAGRVVGAEHTTTGEVVLRVADEIRVVYRRLVPSSVTVRTGATVEAGDVLGVVAPTGGSDLAGLQFGLQRPDGTWETVAEVLVGLPDPLELFLKPPRLTPAARARRRDDAIELAPAPEPAAPAPPPPQPPPPPEPTPPTPAVPEAPAPAPEPPAPGPAPEAPAQPAARTGGASKLTSRRNRGPRAAPPAPPVPVPPSPPPVPPPPEPAPPPTAPPTDVERGDAAGDADARPSDEPADTTDRTGPASRLAGRRRRPGSSTR